MLSLIAIVDSQWNIGYHNQLLFHLPTDMAHFKKMTEGKTVIMGRNTFDSLPHRKPLSYRRNIVLTRSPLVEDKVLVCSHLHGLFALIKHHPQEEHFVIGGQLVYDALLPYCNKAYITKVETVTQADRTLIDLDKLSHWRIAEQSPPNYENHLIFRFLTYINQNVVPMG